MFRLNTYKLTSQSSTAGHRHLHSNHASKRQSINVTAQSQNSTTQGPAANSTEYDYIVVGSGPGGGPLASRLAIAGYKVLLIDAGDDHGDAVFQQVPALQLQATEYAPMRWDYFVNHYPDESRQEQDSKMVWDTPSGDHYVGNSPPAGSNPLGIWYPRTGTLGGCAAHNAMITIYPHESDWNNIASVTGDDTWRADNMRKYFQRLERCRYLPNSVVGHGFDGWFETSLTELSLAVEDTKLLSLIISAGTAMGKGLLGKVINTVAGLGEVLLRDINAYVPSRDSQEGLYQVPIAVTEVEKKRNGPRDFILATANAVNPDGSRKYHLDIKLNTLVTKVRFDTTGTKPKAVGVDYIQGPRLYRADPLSKSSSTGTEGSVDAGKEVIVSAGAFNSPQLLKLSGVGPKAELEKFDIPVVVDLPGVGTNLQDRYEATIVGDSNTDFAITHSCTFLRTEPDPCLEQWKNLPGPSLKGTYATNGIAVAVVKRSSAAGPGDDPDLLISGAPAYFTGYHPGYANESLKDAHHWAWIVLKAHSRNDKGTVTLRSTDPRDTPLINFNYFDTGNTADGADEKDLEAVYEGMQLSREMFRDYIPLQGTFKEVWPGEDRVDTKQQMKDWIKKEAWGHHASCTCPIGADDDPNAVLDSKFRVRGADGLRVVDASVYPKIPGYYIVLPTYMVSEKAADAVLEDA